MSHALKHIDQTEIVSRYIMDKNCYAATKNRVKYSAFMPSKNGEVSVYRISGISEHEIWDIGKKYVAEKRNKKLRARADLPVRKISNERLGVISEPNPHPLHANIINWPEDKSKRLLIAIKLADD